MKLWLILLLALAIGLAGCVQPPGTPSQLTELTRGTPFEPVNTAAPPAAAPGAGEPAPVAGLGEGDQQVTDSDFSAETDTAPEEIDALLAEMG